jgi:diacylglycerol kinase (ATP)
LTPVHPREFEVSGENEASLARASQVSTTPRALVLANPGKRAHHAAELGMARLRESGIDLDDAGQLTAERMDHLLDRAREAGLIVVIGGDGTMNRYAPFLLKAGLPVGILPAGTANDLARTLHIPLDPESAARVIVSGQSRAIDLGEVNGHPFFNVASIGMSVDLARNLTGAIKRRFGRLAYPITAARVSFSYRPFRARVSGAEGEVEVKSLQIAVGNGRYYGGGLAVNESAAIDDGHLHLYSLEMSSAWKMLPMLWCFRRGTHGRWATVRTLTGDTYEIRTERPKDVNADGEIVTTTPCTIRILPAALRVFVP